MTHNINLSSAFGIQSSSYVVPAVVWSVLFLEIGFESEIPSSGWRRSGMLSNCLDAFGRCGACVPTRVFYQSDSVGSSIAGFGFIFDIQWHINHPVIKYDISEFDCEIYCAGMMLNLPLLCFRVLERGANELSWTRNKTAAIYVQSVRNRSRDLEKHTPAIQTQTRKRAVMSVTGTACKINIKNMDYFKYKKIVIDGSRDDYSQCSREVRSLCDCVQTLAFRDEEFDEASDRTRFQEIISNYR